MSLIYFIFLAFDGMDLRLTTTREISEKREKIAYWSSSTADIKIVLVDISSALPILISAVSGPLGFVVGYYFKTEANK